MMRFMTTPGDRGQGQAPAIMVEIERIDGNGFRPAEARESKHDESQKIEMYHGIEAAPPLIFAVGSPHLYATNAWANS